MKELFLKIIEPKTSVTDPGVRRHARLQNLLILILIFFTFLAAIFPEFFMDDPNIIFIGALFGFVVTNIPAFILSRSGRVTISSTIMILGTTSLVLYSGTRDINLLPYLVIPLLLSSIFLKIKNFVRLAIVILSMVLLTPIFIDNFTIGDCLYGIFTYILIAAIIILFGIWDRKKVEELNLASIKEREEHFKAIFTNVSEGIITIDNEGTIISLNKGAEIIFGYKSNELIGQKLDTLFSEWRQLLKNNNKEKNGKTILITATRSNNIKFPAEISIAKWELYGKKYLTVILRDKSEQEKSEQEIQSRSRDLERINKVLVGRELKMIDLKKENEQLRKKLDEMWKNKGS